VGWNTLTLDDYIIPPPRKRAKSLAPHAPEGFGAAASGAGTEAAVRCTRRACGCGEPHPQAAPRTGV